MRNMGYRRKVGHKHCEDNKVFGSTLRDFSLEFGLIKFK